MNRAVILNKEQSDMLDRLKEASSQFDKSASLRSNAEAIDSAKSLIAQAHQIGMPSASYVALQIYVSHYDTEMGLPEHLRDTSRL